jgi:HD-GYP domain-containing protein (c-di-GMP phosphodiesterase class II)
MPRARRFERGADGGRRLADLVRAKDAALREHADAVAGLASAVAVALGLDEEDRTLVARAAELHDVGKLVVPSEVIRKPGPLDTAERELMEGHTLIGEAIVGALRGLRPVAALVRSSHERWDGTGYPDRLTGARIPLGARIIAVCDAYVAMVERRTYGTVLGEDAALAELRRCAGTQFDPQVVEAFCAVMAPAARAA